MYTRRTRLSSSFRLALPSVLKTSGSRITLILIRHKIIWKCVVCRRVVASGALARAVCEVRPKCPCAMIYYYVLVSCLPLDGGVNSTWIDGWADPQRHLCFPRCYLQRRHLLAGLRSIFHFVSTLNFMISNKILS